MTGNDDGNGVLIIGTAHRSTGFFIADSPGNVLVATDRSVRNILQSFPDLLLNALIMGGFGFCSALILGVTVGKDPVNGVPVFQINAGRESSIFVAKVKRDPRPVVAAAA